MTQRKRLEGALADWHPHPKSAAGSLVPVVRDPAPTDEVTERFFSDAPEAPTPELPPIVETGEHDAAPEPAAIRARRRYLMRYVAGAVSLAALIGVGAIVRVTSARGAVRSNSNAVAAALRPVVLPPVDPDPVAPAEAPATDLPAQNPDDQLLADLSEQDQSASDAKKQSLHELELDHFVASIEAGERSVAQDPTDADAWLILGAAYLKRGAYADARRCFTTCGQHATHGDRFQCWALLR
jgi:tetratricopeptide repeat protein